MKPRLYLTGWPCFVLSSRRLAAPALRLARQGVLQLLNGGVVRVSEGAVPGMSPAERPTLVSYRHTLRAVQILLALGEPLESLESTLGWILDLRRNWQNDDGGWAQCDTMITGSDLWGSSYAAGLLLWIISSEKSLSGVDRVIAKKKLRATVRYLEHQWAACKWAIGETSAAQNAPVIFHEVAESLAIARSPALSEVLQWLKQWITPAGTLSQDYYTLCKDTARASASIRMAYAFHVGGAPVDFWRPLFHAAIREFDSGAGMNSADVAFCLDLSEVSLNTVSAETKNRPLLDTPRPAID